MENKTLEEMIEEHLMKNPAPPKPTTEETKARLLQSLMALVKASEQEQNGQDFLSNLVELIHSEMDSRVLLLYETIRSVRLEAERTDERLQSFEYEVNEFTHGRIANLDKRIQDGFTAGVAVQDERGNLVGMVHHGRFLWQCSLKDVARILHYLRDKLGYGNSHTALANFGLQFMPKVASEANEETLVRYLKDFASTKEYEEGELTTRGLHLPTAVERAYRYIVEEQRIRSGIKGG